MSRDCTNESRRIWVFNYYLVTADEMDTTDKWEQQKFLDETSTGLFERPNLASV